MKCIGILWNSLGKFNKQAVEDISNNICVDKVMSINLGENLSNFIWDIYETDLPIVQERIKIKIQNTADYFESKEITIMFIDIDENIVSDVVTYLKQLKKMVREKYSKVVGHYQFDNVFHLTENDDEYMRIINALRRYGVIESEQENFVKKMKK